MSKRSEELLEQILERVLDISLKLSPKHEEVSAAAASAAYWNGIMDLHKEYAIATSECDRNPSNYRKWLEKHSEERRLAGLELG